MIIPKKSLGQNFLIDKNIVNKILKFINIKNNKIIEIGPGLGILTSEIYNLKPKKFLIIEKDNTLTKILQKKNIQNNVIILNEDALKFNFSKLKNFTLISNLPYNISSKFLLKVIKFNKNITNIICMIQSELADKFDYKKGKMNKYKFISKYCSDYDILFEVSPKVFYPKPKVYSKVVSFKLKKKNIDTKKLDYFIKFFFINKRKQIKSNKIFSSSINESNIHKRYEDLSYKDVLDIYERFNLPIS